MTTLQVLVAVRKLLGTKGQHWCRNHYAKSKNGVSVNPRSSIAVEWCLLGAMRKISGHEHIGAVDALRDLTGDDNIDEFNDRQRWVSIREVLQKAIDNTRRTHGKKNAVR